MDFFLVLLDVKGRILGYQTVDLAISSPVEVMPKEELEEGKESELIRFIKMFGFRCLAGLIHAKVFNYQPVLIIKKDIELDLDEVNSFLDDIVPEMYKNHRILKSIDYNPKTFPLATYFYALVMNQRRTAFLLNLHKHIIQMPWKTGLDFEKSMIASIVQKQDHNEHLKYLSFYITKFLEDVDKAMIIVEPIKKISKKDMVKKLKEIAITSTVTKNYVSCIKEFIHRRVSPQIAKKIHD